MEKATTPKRSRGRGRGRGKGRSSAKQTPEKDEPVKIEDTEMEAEDEAEVAPEEIAEDSKDNEATEVTDEQLLQDNEGSGQEDEQFAEGYEGMDGEEESYEQFGEEEFYDEAEDNENDEAAEEAPVAEEDQSQEEEKPETNDKDDKASVTDGKQEEKKEKREAKSKSREPVKRRGFPPKPKHSSHLDISQMIKFVRAEWGYCTVYVGPLQVEDLATEVIKKATHAARWSAFRYFRKLDNEQFGTLELRFRSRDEADVCTKEMDAVEGKTYVIKNFKQLKEDNSKIPYFLSIVNMEDWGNANRNMLYSQLENVGINSDSVWVYIENIPEDMSETDLRQELENCAEVVFPRDADGKPQGFCYAHMSDISTRANFTSKSKTEESVTVRGQPLHVYRLIQGYGADRFKRIMPAGGGPMMKRPRPDSYGGGHSSYGSGYRGAKPYEGRTASRGQGRYSPPGRGRFRGSSTGYRSTRGGYSAGAGFRDSREEGGVHKLLSGLEKILERHERDDRPRGGGGEFNRDFSNAGRYGDSGGYGRRDFGSSDKYQNTRFSRDNYGSGGGGSVGRPHRGHDSGSRYGSRDDFRRGSSPNRGYGGGYSGRYSPHRSSYASGVGSSRLPFGSGGSSSWGSGYMGN